MSAIYANNAYSTLSAGINNSVTSLTLAGGEGARFPNPSGAEYFYATLIDTSNNLEIVKCTARSTDTLTITRAQDGTAARAWVTGDRVEVRVTKAVLDEFYKSKDLGVSVQSYDATIAKTGSALSWTAAQRSPPSALADGATVTPDFALRNNFSLGIGGNRTLATPTNLAAGQDGYIAIRQDSTGSRTLSYSWAWNFTTGTAPTLSTTALTLDSLFYSVEVYATSTVTITIATPGVVTWTAHGLVTGQKIQLTTTGALPTGLSASTTYYVIKIDADTFWLATSLANAAVPTKIATSGSQSGTHTMVAATIAATLFPGVA